MCIPHYIQVKLLFLRSALPLAELAVLRAESGSVEIPREGGVLRLYAIAGGKTEDPPLLEVDSDSSGKRCEFRLRLEKRWMPFWRSLFLSSSHAAAAAAGMPFCPGVATASELSQALSAGCKMVKFFPAEAAGGVGMIKNLLGAFRFTGVKFMPTGGVKISNVESYLSVPEIVCCGGTWIVPKDALSKGDFAAIESLASEASSLVRKIRG